MRFPETATIVEFPGDKTLTTFGRGRQLLDVLARGCAYLTISYPRPLPPKKLYIEHYSPSRRLDGEAPYRSRMLTRFVNLEKNEPMWVYRVGEDD